jgi:peptidoglycan/LPS O-acetylase OafA/YrhL
MSWMIAGLDGLRAIAFLLVFALHTNYLQVGWVGVSLFFVLSGFLISGILLDMKKHLAAKEYFIKFYGRRFLRIFPLYYFYLLLAALLTLWLLSLPYRPQVMQLFWAQLWYAILYVYDFFFATAAFQHSNFLNHFWSLSVEEQFYIFWPLLILLAPEKSLKKLFVLFIVVGPTARLVLFLIYRSGVFRFLAETPSLFVYPLPFSHIDAFALGAYISRFQIPRARQQFWGLAILLPIIGFATQFFTTGSFGKISSLGYPFLLPDGYQFIWAYSLVDYFFAVTIYGVVHEGWATRFLESRPLRYLGRISYGLYVYHYPIVWFAGRIVDLGVSPPVLQPLVALIAFCGTLLIASLSFRFLEKPIIDLKDRLFPFHSTRNSGKVVASHPEASANL